MHTVRFSDARNDLQTIFDQAYETGEPVLITRLDAPNAVVMSQKKYNGLLETLYLLGSPANAARLIRSIQSLRRDEATKGGLLDMSL